MLRYVDTMTTFSEVPDEISLCINFSGCRIRCEGCHSSYLWEDIGEFLTLEGLDNLVKKNSGVTCVCLMGGNDPCEVNAYAKHIKEKHHLKVAWYMGLDGIPFGIDLGNFDYVKVGKYDKEKGGLNSPHTNQRMYRIEDITNRFLTSK